MKTFILRQNPSENLEIQTYFVENWFKLPIPRFSKIKTILAELLSGQEDFTSHIHEDIYQTFISNAICFTMISGTQ